MSFLQRIAACNQCDLTRYIPFVVADLVPGRLLPTFADKLRRWPGIFTVETERVVLNPELGCEAERTQAVAEVTAQLAAEGVIEGWRDERYPVRMDTETPILFEIERAAVPHFGFRAWGVHVNGLVRQGDETLVWIGRRAADKSTFPGMLDHLAAGGQPVGIGWLENVIKECGEEAGVPPELATHAEFVREIYYCCDTSTGLKPDTIRVYDLYLPESFEPHNVDGEMESFELWSLDQVAEVVANSERFKPNCNLVLIDLLLRQGYPGIEPGEAQQIVQQLYRPLQNFCDYLS